MAITYLIGSAVAILLLVVVIVWISQTRRHSSDRIRGRFFQDDEEVEYGATISKIISSPITWTISFVFLAIAGTGSAILYLSDATVPFDPFLGVAAVIGVIVVGFLAIGIYATARNRGHSNAMSVMEALIVIGLVGIFAAVSTLVMG